jgi:hypothetical protein
MSELFPVEKAKAVEQVANNSVKAIFLIIVLY